MLPVKEMAKELRRVADVIGARPVLGHWPHMQAHLDVQLLQDAAAKLERYDELFRWSNENCAACGEGDPLPHAQPLPDPESQSDAPADQGEGL